VLGHTSSPLPFFKWTYIDLTFLSLYRDISIFLSLLLSKRRQDFQGFFYLFILCVEIYKQTNINCLCCCFPQVSRLACSSICIIFFTMFISSDWSRTLVHKARKNPIKPLKYERIKSLTLTSVLSRYIHNEYHLNTWKTMIPSINCILWCSFIQTQL
jgi:hypothetical protein